MCPSWRNPWFWSSASHIVILLYFFLLLLSKIPHQLLIFLLRITFSPTITTPRTLCSWRSSMTFKIVNPVVIPLYSLSLNSWQNLTLLTTPCSLKLISSPIVVKELLKWDTENMPKMLYYLNSYTTLRSRHYYYYHFICEEIEDLKLRKFA